MHFTKLPAPLRAQFDPCPPQPGAYNGAPYLRSSTGVRSIPGRMTEWSVAVAPYRRNSAGARTSASVHASPPCP